MTEADLFNKVLERAHYLLAMREHGDRELLRKLQQKFAHLEADHDLLSSVLQLCQERNWQSDERYVESYVRQALAKGQGALKIRQALQRTTTHNGLIESYLSLDELDWVDYAKQVLQKKYGTAETPTDKKEQAKRLRFLQSRGFSTSQCYKAMTR